MEESRKIFIDGLSVDAVKDDPKLETFFAEFDDKIFRIAEKKFLAMCKKHAVRANITVLIRFEED